MSFEIVEVRAHYLPANTPIPSNLFGEFDLILTHAPNGTVARGHGATLKNIAFPIEDVQRRLDNIVLGNAPEVRLPMYDLMFMDFVFVGEAFNEYAGGTEWNMREGNGVAEDMAWDAEKLWKISHDLLLEEFKRREHNPNRSPWSGSLVRWLTVFDFQTEPGTFDDPTPSYSSEFVGRLDLNLVGLAIVETPGTVKP